MEYNVVRIAYVKAAKGNGNIVLAAKNASVKLFIHMSSMIVYKEDIGRKTDT